MVLIRRWGREVCGHLANAEHREWLVTNGIGGYAAGTVSGLLTRHYHGLLIAALKPPLGRTLLLAKLDETVNYGGQSYDLFTNRWADGSITPKGYMLLEAFSLEGNIPIWTYACGEARVEKRLWMAPGENTTYIRYTLTRGIEPLHLSLKALVNYRNHHGSTQDVSWPMTLTAQQQGVKIVADAEAIPFYLLSETADYEIIGSWYRNYDLSVEQYRGLPAQDDHFHSVTFNRALSVGESVTIVVSTLAQPSLNSTAALRQIRGQQHEILGYWYSNVPDAKQVPVWLEQLVLAANQFVVDRTIVTDNNQQQVGKTLIAGYPWFGDWGRDTMISLPGITLSTGRPDIAHPILRTFAQYLDQGMLPNVFPEAGEKPDYNTVDAILWYFEAIRAYYQVTKDLSLLKKLFPALAEVVDWHLRGTRYNIHWDSQDGLIYAGETGVQLTWMDAKIGDWVITPRIGKPIEINALWYNALMIMVDFSEILQQPSKQYKRLADQARKGFQKFWNGVKGCCYDVLDGPDGDDETFRPNQIFAVALPDNHVGLKENVKSLLPVAQQKAVVDAVARQLLTSYGLRSLAPDHPDYQGQYGGDPRQRDSAYHQGPVWGWLIGPFVQAHLKVYQNPEQARSFLEPFEDHLYAGCIGTLSEIFDGDAPHASRGAFAQAWTVAEVLRAYLLTVQSRSTM